MKGRLRGDFGELSTFHQQQCSARMKGESAFLPQKEGITRVFGMSKMANPNDPADNLKWFYEHCSSRHYFLETTMPMLDVAVFIMDHNKTLDILLVSNQVKADLVRSTLQ